MSKEYDEEDEEKFESRLGQLKSYYKKDPELADKELKRTIKRIKLAREIRKHSILGDMDIDIIIPLIVSAAIVLVGLINFETFFMYIFGVVFFLAGYFVATNVEGMGLIFLFSHGITGLCLMVGSMLSKIGVEGLLDSPFSVRIVMALALALFIAGTVTAIMCNLSKNFKELAKNLPLIIYFFGFFVTAVLVRYYFEIGRL